MAISLERPPIASQPISVVLLTGGHSERVAQVGKDVANDLAILKREHEILIADCGSAPGVETALNLPQARVIRPAEVGYGRALQAAIIAARYPMLFSLAADGGYQTTFLHHLLTMIDEADIVAGYRPSRAGWRGWRQRFGPRWLFGLGLHDPRCPVRLYRRSIFARMPIQSSTRFAEVEILAKANFLGCLMAEAAIPWEMPDDVASGPSTSADAGRLFRQPKFHAQPAGLTS